MEEKDAGETKDSWSSIQSNITLNNSKTNVIKEDTRQKYGDNLAKLDVMITKEPDEIKDLKHLSPEEKIDHVVIEFQTIENTVTSKKNTGYIGMEDTISKEQTSQD